METTQRDSAQWRSSERMQILAVATSHFRHEELDHYQCTAAFMRLLHGVGLALNRLMILVSI